MALGFIWQLYAADAQSKGLDSERRLELRKTTSAPPVADYKAWLDVEGMKVLPKSPMGEAIRYALGQ